MKILKERGITLIALVITIIVLLILAGVTLSIVMKTGITDNALKAKDISQISSYKDSIEMIKTGEILKKRLKNLDTSLKDLVVEQLREQTWVSTVRTNAEEGSLEENQIQVITKDGYIIVAEIQENGTINYLVEDKYDGEPYPTISLKQLPLEGTENEKIKIEVTASVTQGKKTKNIVKIEVIKDGKVKETKTYNTSNIEETFEVEENGIYEFRATTDQGKSSSKKIFIDIHGTENTVKITQEPEEARNTIVTTGQQNGVKTGAIQVTIEYGETDLTKEYQIGEGTEWKTTDKATETLEIKENISISARYSDGTNKFGTKSIQISNVDNVAPNEFTIEQSNIQTTSNSITITGINVKDTASENAGPGIAEILRYEYKLDTGSWQNNEGMFTGVETGPHKIKVKAIDKAGNERESKNELDVTVSEPTTGEITITMIPTTARNTTKDGPVKVTINYEDNSYKKIYKRDTYEDWTELTEEDGASITLDFTENGGITAGYSDGTNKFGTKSDNVANVDNVAPTIKNINATVNKTTITVTADINDEASENAGPNIKGVQSTTYSIDSGAYQTQNTFTVSTSGKHTINIKAVDKAGNEKIEPTEVTVTGYTLTVTAGTGGTASGGGEKIEGQSCTVTATPSAGYEFLGWYEGETQKSTNVTYTFTMPKNAYILQARFVQVFTVTVQKGDGIKTVTVSGNGKVRSGGNLTITATLESGYDFTGWTKVTGDGTIADANNLSTTITPTSNVTVKATAKKSISLDNTKGTENKKVIESEEKAKNPVIPAGFKTKDTEKAKWKSTDGKTLDDWNKGLVIEDSIGNEFVWVPVDGKDVTYTKWIIEDDWYLNRYPISNGPIPTKVTGWGQTEQSQINNYGGFYIARYEAGIPDATTMASKNARNISNKAPLSKKNQIPWNYINWTNAKTNAELMYSNNNVQSGLLTGTMWDVTVKWLVQSEAVSSYEVENNSSTWANSQDAVIPKITSYSTSDMEKWNNVAETTKSSNDVWMLLTGETEYTNRGNIYDLAGNVMEWTSEYQDSNPMIRGDDCMASATGLGGAGYVMQRNFLNAADTFWNTVGFRVCLFIK